MTHEDVPYFHETDTEIFLESLLYSSAETGFTASLLEKDYYCSLILDHFYRKENSLVFKGGTSLSKVYMDFYRLSEDLDFSISVSTRSTKSQRKSKIDPIKTSFGELPDSIPGIMILDELTGHNQSRQYIGTLQYDSVVMEKAEYIQLEIGLREPFILAVNHKHARTIGINPFTHLSLFPRFSVVVMNIAEAFAEKVRAALTRREPAIRDYYDIYLAVTTGKIDISDHRFLELIKTKLKVPGNGPIDVSLEKKEELSRQLNTQLKPVLRPEDFEKFYLDKVYGILENIAERIHS